MMKTDFHLHTFLSDGTPSPSEMVEACLDIGLTEISITDHDSIGAYPEVFGLAPAERLRIVPGCEFDCVHQEMELHMLGYGFDTGNRDLNRHLFGIQGARKRRALEQAEAINAIHGKPIIDLEKICARSQTFMNPHLIHAMIIEGLFDHYPTPDRYKQAQSWMKQNVRVDAIIQKPSAEEIIRLIHEAGGRAVLAHPAYYRKDGLSLDQLIQELKQMGLDGIEVVYPYFQGEGSARDFPTLEHERTTISVLHQLATRFDLKESSGSDSHEIEQLKAYHARA